MTTEQLAALKEVAEKSGSLCVDAIADVLHFPRTADDDTRKCAEAQLQNVSEFIAAFDPTTCLELLEEVERLRQIERSNQALDKLTDRHLKSEVSEVLKL